LTFSRVLPLFMLRFPEGVTLVLLDKSTPDPWAASSPFLKFCLFYMILPFFLGVMTLFWGARFLSHKAQLSSCCRPFNSSSYSPFFFGALIEGCRPFLEFFPFPSLTLHEIPKTFPLDTKRSGISIRPLHPNYVLQRFANSSCSFSFPNSFRTGRNSLGRSLPPGFFGVVFLSGFFLIYSFGRTDLWASFARGGVFFFLGRSPPFSLKQSAFSFFFPLSMLP